MYSFRSAIMMVIAPSESRLRVSRTPWDSHLISGAKTFKLARAVQSASKCRAPPGTRGGEGRVPGRVRWGVPVLEGPDCRCVWFLHFSL